MFHATMRRPVEARAAIAEARKADPHAAGSYVAEGLLADHENKEPEARAAYGKAAELNTTSPYAYYRLASLTWQPNASKDVYAELDKHLTMAVKMNTRYAAAYAWLGEVRTVLGNTEAIGLVRRAIQLEPMEPTHRLRAAFVLLRVGQPTEARAEAEAALALADNDAERHEAERVLEAARKAEAVMKRAPRSLF
jgi:tetratricopeptide (TPR) repeat protein